MDKDLIDLIEKAKPQVKGNITRSALLSGPSIDRPKAVLFVPVEGALDDELDIEIVGLDASVLAAMVARRC